jgi:hypothetical protein
MEAEIAEREHVLHQIERAEKWGRIVAGTRRPVKAKKNDFGLGDFDEFRLNFAFDDDLFLGGKPDFEAVQADEGPDEIQIEKEAIQEEKEKLEAEKQIVREREAEVAPERQSVFDHKAAAVAAAKRMVLLYRRVVEDDD